MQSKQTPIVIAILAVGIIITLAIVLTRNNNQDTTEPANVAETEQQTEQETQPTPEPVPAPQPTPPGNGLPANWDSLTDQQKMDSNPFDCNRETHWVSTEDGSCLDKATHIGEDDIKLDGLPANWDSLTAQEKTDLNPFDCDHETQWVSAEDGSCIDRPTDPISSPSSEPLYALPNGWSVLRYSQACAIADFNDAKDVCHAEEIITIPASDIEQTLSMRRYWQAYVPEEIAKSDRDLSTQEWTFYLKIYSFNGSYDPADYSEEDLVKSFEQTYSDPSPADCPRGWIELSDGSCIIED